jgi:predicted nucleic acid-binding protein
VNGNDEVIVLDSNAVIDLLKSAAALALLEQRFPGAVFCVSIITFIEVLGFPKITPEMEAQILAFFADVTIIGVPDDIVKIAIDIRRRKLVKLPDAVIAATAIDFGATLITRDTDLLDFPYPGLRPSRIK